MHYVVSRPPLVKCSSRGAQMRALHPSPTKQYPQSSDSLSPPMIQVPRPSSPEQNLLAQIETFLVRLINNQASSYLSSFGPKLIACSKRRVVPQSYSSEGGNRATLLRSTLRPLRGWGNQGSVRGPLPSRRGPQEVRDNVAAKQLNGVNSTGPQIVGCQTLLSSRGRLAKLV